MSILDGWMIDLLEFLQMTGDAEIEALAKHVYSKTRHFDGDRIANLIIRLIDCFESDKDWLTAVREHCDDEIDGLEG